MLIRLLLLTTLFLPVGCSRQDNHAIYDTDTNPDNFPPEAVEVIRQIESGSLVGSEAVTGAFGDLLTRHGDLLDRPEWRDVVGRMGDLFRKVGDSLSGLGIASYGLAAEYYQLAALGRPDDSATRSLNGMFSCWRAAEEEVIDGVPIVSAAAGGLNQVVGLCRRFMLADTPCQSFLANYLRPEILRNGANNGLQDPEQLAQLSPADRALLASAGLIDGAALKVHTRFAPPQIDLLAVRFSRIDTASCLAELYFCPREPIPAPLKVHLRVNSTDGTAWPIEIVPPRAATTWTPGQVALVTRVFNYSGTPASAAIGLSDFAVPRPGFLRSDKSRRDLSPLDSADIVVN